MAHLKRFEGFRYIGDRVSMKVYDTGSAEQLAALEERVAADRLHERNLLQSFAPDDPIEARNRGFKSAFR